MTLFDNLIFTPNGESLRLEPFILARVVVPPENGQIISRRVAFWLQHSSNDRPTDGEIKTIIKPDKNQALAGYESLPKLELCHGAFTHKAVAGRGPQDTRLVFIRIEELFAKGKTHKNQNISKAFKDKTPTLKGCLWTMIPEDAK